MKMGLKFFVFLMFLSTPLLAQIDKPLRPVATYSIVARDSTTGQLGVAV